MLDFVLVNVGPESETMSSSSIPPTTTSEVVQLVLNRL